jgi:RNA polymerase sigma factor (sigma-70 family)
VDHDKTNQHLSDISTVWTVLQQAHNGPPDTVAAAQRLLMHRYGGAVRRYLLALLGDPHLADDLTQEFAVALVRGDFRRARPERGRFRNYVKTALFHLVDQHRKKHRRQAQPLPPDAPALTALTAPADDADRAFRESWREQLLARAWEALAEARPSYYAVLHFCAAHDRLGSEELAQELSRELGKPFTAESARQARHRARKALVQLLIDEVAHSLDKPTPEDVEQELRDLDLLDYCRLARRRQPPEA